VEALVAVLAQPEDCLVLEVAAVVAAVMLRALKLLL
jgi:hypothetical protein